MTESRKSLPVRAIGRGWMIACLTASVTGLFLLAVSVLLGTLMLVIGIYCGVQLVRMRAVRADPGVLEFQADPSPGALEGDVGGWIRFSDARLADTEPVVELACVRLSERQRSQIIEHRRETVWRECRPTCVDREANRIGFCFTPPAHLPETEVQPEVGELDWSQYHYWVVTLKGQIDGLDYSRSFRLPVRRGHATMENALPEGFHRVNEPLGGERTDAMEHLREQIGLVGDAEVIRFVCPPSRGQWLEPVLAGAGLFLMLAGLAGTVSGFWRLVWLVTGLALALSMGFRWGRGLATEMRGPDFAVTTFWFGRPLFVRRTSLSGDAELVVHPRLVSMLRFDGTADPGYDLMVHDGDRKVLVARDISGKAEAEALTSRLREQAGRENVE